MIIVFIVEINNNNNKKRKELEIHLDVYLHVNPILLIINQYAKILLQHMVNKTKHFIHEIIRFFFIILIDNEMTESTTGTLLSLGKTEFDRRIKKK
jgi:hypothetical protein